MERKGVNDVSEFKIKNGEIMLANVGYNIYEQENEPYDLKKDRMI